MTLLQLLSKEPFPGLKTILEAVSPGESALQEAILAVNSYEELLARLGYKLTVTRQIHLQDCYSRLGQAGGIKAVLPYYDIPTQSSFPTLVNFDGTITATEKSAAYFDGLFQAFKKQWSVAQADKVQV